MTDIQTCPFTTIEASRSIDVKGHPHAGTLAHRCIRAAGHQDKSQDDPEEHMCKCVCGHRWTGWGSEVRRTI